MPVWRLDKDETGRIFMKFDFEHVEAKKVKDVKCPICGGDIVQTPFGFGCANYSKTILRAPFFHRKGWRKEPDGGKMSRNC